MRGKLREGRLVSEWEKKRKRFFEERGIKIEEMSIESDKYTTIIINYCGYNCDISIVVFYLPVTF